MNLIKIFGFFLITNITFAEELSWPTCVKQMLQNNAELRSARETLESFHYATRGSYSNFFPQVSGSLTYNYGNSTSTTGSNDSTYGASITATQNLFNGLHDKASTDQASANEIAQQASFEITLAKVSFDLKSAYSNLLFAQKSLYLQQDIVHRREQNLKLVELRFQSGRENKGSVLLSKANLKQANYEVLQSEHGIGSAQLHMAQVLGSDNPNILLRDAVPLSTPQEKINFSKLVSSTPDHKQSLAQEDAANAGISIARSGFFPTLGVSGTASKTGEWYPDTNRWNLGVTLTVPLFAGGRDYFATQGAISIWKAADYSLVNGDRELVTKLREAYDNYTEAIEKYEVDQSFKDAATKRAEIARGKYNNGLMTFEDWDLIENDLINRQKTTLVSERDRTTSEATWLQAQGKGVTR